MKKILTLFTATSLALLFTACDTKKETDYTGYWYNTEYDSPFEVIKNEKSYVIRNINGDMPAEIQEGKLCGKNSLNMPYSMTVKGDSAYYEFSGFLTGYKRVSKAEYDKVSANKTKVNFKENNDNSAAAPAGQ